MASSSSSSYARMTYDVFLSFRGETRNSFSDHLYVNLRRAGVNTFEDYQLLLPGGDISVEVSRAIEESRISIIIFSKNYVGSLQCLDELVKIIECKQKLNQIVIPIFYNVSPSEVRKQTSTFGDALDLHKQRFGDQKVRTWKDALTAVANLSGWDLSMSNGYESKFIEKITYEVLRMLNILPNVAKYPIGIDSHVTEALDLLQIQTNDDDGVRMMGIFGMGGVGKSTLAIAIYNHLNMSFQSFEGSCFVANIRQEVSNKGHNGLVGIQEKLLQNILKTKNFEINNVHEGIRLIKLRLQSKKVLIVLDDIDHISQLESLAGQRNWFGCGSIVIITTRNVNLLKDLIKAHEKYEIQTLSSHESSQLLSLHAFGVLVPPEEYTKLFKRIVRYTRGIPLTLAVLGSRLRGKSVEEWNNEVEKLGLKEEESNEVEKLGLKEGGSNEIEKLGLKEEGSNEVEKLGLKEEGSNEVEKLGLKEEGSNEVEKLGLKEEGSNEVEKLGLKEEESNEVEKLGLKEEGSNEDEKWKEEGSNEVEVEADIKKVHRKIYDELDGITQSIFLDIACFFIGLIKNDIVQDFGVEFETGIRTLIDKSLLTIHRSEEKEELQMQPLVWEMAIEIIRNESPQDPSKRSRLMDPRDVYDVIKGKKGTGAIEGMYVHSSMLKNKSVSTKVLSKMKNLRLLKLDGVRLKGSFEHLPKELRWFWWHNCPLKDIPSDFHHEKLEVFRLQGSNIRSVQLKMQHFKSLRILKFGGCEQLEKTPNFTGAENLQILSFKYCKNLVELHSSIGCLKSLIELDLAFCQKIKTLPESICQLESLQFLYLNDCSSLGKLPLRLGELGQLRTLHVHNTDISFLPTSLGELKKLKILYVGWHNLLLPNSKSCIRIFFPSTFGNLCSLEALFITYNHLHDEELRGFERLSSLKLLSIKGSYNLKSFLFDRLLRLEILELEECPNLNELVQLPPSLLKLSAKNCPSLRKVDISNLKRLKELYIPNCNNLIELLGLENLDSLHRLGITNCSALTIPRTESCYQAYSEGGDVEIWLQMVGSSLYCTIPSLRHKFFDIIHGGFDPNYTCKARIIVRSRTTGALILKKVKDDIVINTSERFHFRVQIMVGEEVEVYAVFQPLKIFSLCVLHRNRDGKVRFSPCPKGFIEFAELAIDDDATEREHPLASKEEVGNSREKAETGVQIVEIIEESPSREEQKTQFPGQDEIMQSEDISKQFQKKVPPSVAPRHREKKGPSPVVPAVAKKPSLSEQIQKLHGESTRIAADMSKLKRGILELLDVAQLPSEEAMTPELSTLFNMLELQIKGTNPLEMTQILLGVWKKYEVERLYQVEEDRVDPLQSDNTVPDVSSDDSETHLPTKKSYNNEGRLLKKPERIDDEVVELFFTPKKFEGLIVVKLGEAIEVTGTGMYSLKPGEMIQDDVINSYEVILRERAGPQPKCWYLPTYICQEAEGEISDEMYERNFQPYAINSTCDIIYLPVFLDSHWYLVKANTESRQAFILDSFITYEGRQPRLDEAIKIMGVLHNLLKEHTRRDPTYQYKANFKDWKFERASWVPQQGNGVDCGAFVMLFMEMADHLTKHTEFNIDMERRRIALELFYHPRNARLSSVLKILDKMM